jgi:SpoVK/Ycf46/Vps4 family AAA+-type ATPase
MDGLLAAGKASSRASSDVEEEDDDDPTTRFIDSWVLVIGATNRPSSVDPAILRRLPKHIRLSLPDAAARQDILKVLLRNESVDPALDYARIAERTEGFSGSDLKARAPFI